MANEQHHSHRDTRLDILRGVGLLCIILAHVGPPVLVMQLRNFDVPLMVLVSGASFSLSRTQKQDYNRYLYSRFLRLVIPTWLFLAFFFGVTFFASFLANRQFPFSVEEVLSSFALMSGIGYVWVIRVLFMIRNSRNEPFATGITRTPRLKSPFPPEPPTGYPLWETRRRMLPPRGPDEASPSGRSRQNRW